ncbi:MAG: putative repeat protein (TIGR03806 family) [Nonlabens sp.]|jgi:uncharacterized repeat protein (TIGR03806 family)|uniref:hypothetical protein n=1 Tax=Nonlabens sp. TaxID=1888209 RepID=UPI0039E54C28
MRISTIFSLLFIAFVLTISCEKDDYSPIENPISPVIVDLASVPYQKLSDYQFFKAPLNMLEPEQGVLEYSLINKLFSDYSIKKRFVWMPEGEKATYVTDDALLSFPVGAVLIKNFYYDNVLPSRTRRIIETRLLFKKTSGWEFADYVWNAAQTEAILDLDGSFTTVDFEKDGIQRTVNYRIPNLLECRVCHKSDDTSFPIGPKPQNMNMVMSYQDGEKNQLAKWQEVGYLEETNATVTALPNWKNPSISLNNRVRGYLEINCAHCHKDTGHCSYRDIRFDFTSSGTDENIGVCEEPDEDLGNGLTHLIRPGTPARSTLYYRLNTNNESERMPLLGRTVKDEEAVELIEDWINSLNYNCN